MRVLLLLVGMVAVSVTLLAQTPSASLDRRAAQPKPSDTKYSSKRMADGKLWTTQNLNVNTPQSYCYEDAELNCRQYGRLYTWESARHGCQALGDGWRLPTDDEWRRMAKQYGGLLEDSADGAKATYRALIVGGTSGFNAMLGGSRISGRYERLEAHGIYWTASDNGSASAPSTTLAKAVKLLIDTGRAGSRWRFPFGVSRSDEMDDLVAFLETSKHPHLRTKARARRQALPDSCSVVRVALSVVNSSSRSPKNLRRCRKG